MEYNNIVHLLSPDFVRDYPPSIYTEILHKQERPYTCLLIDSHDDYFICVPFRSSINHKNAFLFRGTARSRQSKSGLDYSKIVIINNEDYIDFRKPAVVDGDEYIEMVANLPMIASKACSYVDSYISHVRGTALLHPREFARRYRYSTLPYFHNVMGI